MDQQPQFNSSLPPQQPYQPSVGVPYKQGGVNKTAVIVILSVLLVIFIGLAAWLFVQKQSLNQTFEADVQKEVNKALSEQETKLREDFEQQLVADTVTFDGPDVLGNIQFSYPKTWSVLIDSSESGTTRLEATIHPQAITNTTTAFAIKLQVLDDQYAEQVSKFQSRVERGELTSRPVTYSGVSGVRLNGEIATDLEGSIVLLPIRDRTLLLQTESKNYEAAFKQALDSLNFTP